MTAEQLADFRQLPLLRQLVEVEGTSPHAEVEAARHYLRPKSDQRQNEVNYNLAINPILHISGTLAASTF